MAAGPNMPSFTYTALAPGEIRLLEPTDAADGLHWSLSTAKVDNELKFDALSYVWGSQSETFPITCNGESLMVHHNLYSALPVLANRYQNFKGRPIWIDAVCINQQDNEEKFVQISLMNRIYRCADTVWVWLGIAEKQDRIVEAIALLPKIAEASRNTKAGFTTPWTSEERACAVSMGMVAHRRLHRLDDSYGLNHLDADIWSAIMHLLNNPWFYRVWVVQEAVLAQNLRFLCGERVIEFPQLKDAIYNTLYYAHVSDTDGKAISFFFNSEYVFYARQMYEQYKKTPTAKMAAFQLIMIAPWLAEHHSCYYAQDRVLGVLGLVDETFLQQTGTNLRTYSSIPELYTMFSTYLMSNVASDHVFWWQWLGLAFTRGRSVGLPSWVPDLHRQGQDFSCSPWATIDTIFPNGDSKFKASNRKSGVRWGLRAEEIILQGVLVDHITFVHPEYPKIPPGLGDDSVPIAELMRFIKDVVNWETVMANHILYQGATKRRVDQHTQDQASLIDAYWRTLLGNKTNNDGDTFTHESYLEYRSVYTAFIDLVSKYKVVERHAAGEDLYISPGSDEYQYYYATLAPVTNGSVAQRFFISLAFLAGRQVFNTEDGRLGFTLSGVQPGDAVCVLNGSTTPHVLKKLGDRDTETYAFVGDAYVHGLMYGEADELDLPVEDLVIV